MSNVFETDGGVIRINGSVHYTDYRNGLACLHDRVVKRGYSKIVLDFSSCTAIFPESILPLIAILRQYMREKGIEVILDLPKDPRLKSLFLNANWAHFLSPAQFEENTAPSEEHLPLTSFKTGPEQDQVVERILEILLKNLPDINRKNLSALEWSLTEITDNVLNHADCAPDGGLVQATTYSDTGKVGFCVCDSGVGIPKTLQVKNHKDALVQAIQEGVTRDRKTNMGNGLFGSYKTCVYSGGRFGIDSGNGRLEAEGEQLASREESVPFSGTLVYGEIFCNQEGLLEKALRFSGRPLSPSHDYIERHYEQDENGNLLISMKTDLGPFGSREAGRKANRILRNLVNMTNGNRIIVDCSDVSVISSSYADEVFGRLFSELGAILFMSKIEFRNTSDTVRMLIDRAIAQRAMASN